MGITVTEVQVYTDLRTFLLSVLPAGVEVVKAQTNRVPEAHGPDFVLMTPLRKDRIETNLDSFSDVKFTGSITGTTMAVSSVAFGIIAPGNQVFGVGVSNNTNILSQISGIPGGAGSYSLSMSQTIAPRTLSAGNQSVVQPTKYTVQLDVHGPNSSDNAQIISTLFRDEFAVDYFNTLGHGITPLLADDPKQIPFIDDQEQYEDRWIIEALLQYNPAITVAQQFADSVKLGIIEVEATYPA